jgi:hypothetical protein
MFFCFFEEKQAFAAVVLIVDIIEICPLGQKIISLI